MSRTRLVFFVEQPLDARNYQRMDIARLQARGLAVEVWDFTPFLHRFQPPIFDPVEFPGLRTFASGRDAVASAGALSRDCFVVCLSPLRWDTLPVYRALTCARVPYAIFEAIATPPITAAGRRGVLARLRGASVKGLVGRALRVVAYRCRWVSPAAFLLAGGERSVDVSSARRRAREVLWLHTGDYDRYLALAAQPAPVCQNTCVFLDEFYPFHLDYALMGIRPPVEAEPYYSTMNRFFTRLEDHHGVRVIVAAHPLSSREHARYFPGRDVVLGHTPELVRAARFVVAHSSTSVNFAVLYRKPVIFVTMDALRRWRLGASIDAMAATLGNRVVNLDHLRASDLDRALEVNDEAYRRYRNAYIKRDGTPDRPFWAQVADRIEGLP